MLPYSDDELSMQMLLLAEHQAELDKDFESFMNFTIDQYAQNRRFKTGELINPPEDDISSKGKQES